MLAIQKSQIKEIIHLMWENDFQTDLSFPILTSLKKSLLNKFSFDILAIHIRSHTISSKHDSLN